MGTLAVADFRFATRISTAFDFDFDRDWRRVLGLFLWQFDQLSKPYSLTVDQLHLDDCWPLIVDYLLSLLLTFTSIDFDQIWLSVHILDIGWVNHWTSQNFDFDSCIWIWAHCILCWTFEAMLQETWYRGPFPYRNGYETRKRVWYGCETRLWPYCHVSWNGNVASTAGNTFQGRTTHVSSLTCVFFF